MKLGFVGTGAITEALVHGLMRSPPAGMSIILSPRSADVASRLADRYAKVVRVAADNQAVADASDTVVLAVRPQVVREVVPILSFRDDQTVISLVAMLSLRDLSPLVAPARRVLRAVPLPSAADGLSPTVLMPPDTSVQSLLESVGTVTEVSDAEAFDALAAASGIMATHVAIAAKTASWLEGRGVAAADARAYVGRILSGLTRTADGSAGTSFPDLVGRHETVGGLNEQLRLHMSERGAFDALGEGLDGLHRRIGNGV